MKMINQGEVSRVLGGIIETRRSATPSPFPPPIIHTQGFRRLTSHLGAYSGLKALWLDSNGLATLEIAHAGKVDRLA